MGWAPRTFVSVCGGTCAPAFGGQAATGSFSLLRAVFEPNCAHTYAFAGRGVVLAVDVRRWSGWAAFSSTATLWPALSATVLDRW